jgi:amino acid adenylation domain-containing protein
MLFHALYAPESDVYLVQLIRRLHGELSVSTFKRAWQLVADRHAVLRTSFLWENLDEPLQIVRNQVSLPWEELDLRGCSPAHHEEQIEHYLRADRDRGFVLSSVPVMRLSLIQLADDTYEFICTYHHILMDGWSISQVFDEVFTAYQALNHGQQPSFEAVYPFSDYIGWLQKQDMAAAENFWRHTLKGFTAPTIPVWGLPERGSAGQRESYHEQQLRLSSSVTAALQALARQHKLTMNTLVQGAWAILLSRYSGAEDIVFGATVAGRPAELAGAASMVGLFINTLPVRVGIATEESLLCWLEKLQEQQVDQRQYEYSPLVAVQEWGEVPRGQPLFESLLVFENYPADNSFESQVTGLKIAPLRCIERTHYPITLIAEPGKELLLKISYDRLRLDDSMITRMLGHLETLLQGIIEKPGARITELPLLTPPEREQLLVEWNQTDTEYPKNRCIHELFEEQVKRTPEKVAIVYGDQQLTYGELNRRSNQLAHHLRKLGVGSEILVGICMERSLEMVVGLLGILKAGGAYVPLDSAHPREHLRLLLGDMGARVLLTQDNLREHLPANDLEVIALDSDWRAIARESEDNPESTCSAENLAYVIYTSGSTGKPKGVLVTHHNVVRLFKTTESSFSFSESDVWTLFHSYAFDFSVWELWGALLYGGRLVVVPYLVSRSPEDFCELLRAGKVTVLNQTPSAFRQLIQAERLSESEKQLSLRLVIFGGEALELLSLKPWFSRHADQLPQLVNMYGITETTVHVTHRPLNVADLENRAGSLIGGPLGDLEVYILDRNQQLVPVGVPGEMYVGGPGVSRGYLKRPDLTAGRFVPHPFAREAGARLYRTGDLARYSHSGDIEYLGRVDRQVKVRGFRIEPGEIEAVLRQHEGVQDCVVVATGDETGQTSLAAYLVLDSVQPPTIEDVRSFAAEKLPVYMVPSAFVQLNQLPLTPNGKLDRRALPEVEHSRSALTEEFVAARTPAEELLVGIWATVLKVDPIGVNDNFFQLGGHSLLATQVMSRVRDSFQVELPLRTLFELPTVAKLCEAIESSRGSIADPRLAAITPASRDARRTTRSEEGALALPNSDGHRAA